MKKIDALARMNFDEAKVRIKDGEYETARYLVQFNPPSDQRIIERRIEQAMANDANRNNSETQA